MAAEASIKMDNSGQGPLRVPGFGGMSMFFQLPASSRFAHGFSEWRQSPLITAQEQAMVIIMNRLTDKPGWSESVFDDDTVARWRAELEAERVQTRQDASGKTQADVLLANPRLLRGATWDWCVQELRDKARDFQQHGHVRVLDTGSCVCKADSLELGALGATMRREVEPLAAAVKEQSGFYRRIVVPQDEGGDEAMADKPWSSNAGSSAYVRTESTWSSPGTGARSSREQMHNLREPVITVIPDALPNLSETITSTPPVVPVGNAFTSTQSNVSEEDYIPYSDGTPSELSYLQGAPSDQDWFWKASHDGKVLDIDGSMHMISEIVDPLNFPLVYGRSLVLQDAGVVPLGNNLESYAKATASQPFDMTVPERHFDESDDGTLANDSAWCKKYQCLPFEVTLHFDAERNDTTTTAARITSYINDIHPDYKGLYTAIESVLSHCIGPWNDCIMPGHGDAYDSDISCQLGRVPLRILTYGIERINTLPAWANAFGKVENLPPLNSEIWKQAEDYLKRPDRAGLDDLDDWLAGWAPGDARTLDLLREKVRNRLERFKHPEPGNAFSYDEWKAGRHGHRAIIDIVPPNKRGWCSQSLTNATQAPQRSPPDPEKCAILPLQEHFRDTGLQVFVEIQSIELTPAEPAYAPDASARSAANTALASKVLHNSLAENKPMVLDENSDMDGWRVAGRLNEHVSAVAVFVFDAENITPPRIAFRQNTDFDEHVYWKYGPGGPRAYRAYEKDEELHNPIPDDAATLGEIFNVPQLSAFTDLVVNPDKRQSSMSVALVSPGSESQFDSNSAPQETGQCQGRLVAFPNVIQHRIEPFQLRDATRPGRLRWLTLYLVDPKYRICSTRNVPPQNHNWWAVPVSRLLARKGLPAELVDQILSYTTGWPLDTGELHHHRNGFSVWINQEETDYCCEQTERY